MKKTKILCTIGPASDSKKMASKLVSAGMDAARINTSHGTLKEYDKTIKMLRSVANITIHLDTAGPQIRLVSRKELSVRKDHIATIGFSKKSDLHFSRDFFKEAKIGAHILLSDGLAEAIVTGKDKKRRELRLKMLSDITLKGNMHSNIPSVYLDIPVISKRDKKVIKLAKRLDVDFINLSFTRRKSDVLAVRKLLKGSNVGIIAKIENHEGVENVNDIIKEVEGVMVARGDLGLEIPAEKVPLLQKQIVKKCNQIGKPVIIATQMLASMTKNRIPTRAETSDVANAVLDGADCIMLSNETAVGAYPVEAVSVMKKIALETEGFAKHRIIKNRLETVPDMISESVYDISRHLPVTKIVAITGTGFTGRMIARFKPKQGVIAVTNSRKVERELKISFGVTSFRMEIPVKKKIILVAKALYKKGLLKKSDLVVFAAGIYLGDRPSSNSIQVHLVRDLLKYMR